MNREKHSKREWIGCILILSATGLVLGGITVIIDTSKAVVLCSFLIIGGLTIALNGWYNRTKIKQSFKNGVNQ